MFSARFLRVTAANFFFFLNFASFFLLPLHVKELGGSEVVVGMVMGAAGLASLGVLPLIGLTIDRVGSRFYLLAGAGLMSVTALSFLFVERIGVLLFVLRVLQGFCFAAAFTATTTFAADFAPREQRARALGVFGLSTLLTHAIAPTLGEEIVRRWGFDTLFVTSAAYAFAAALLALGLPAGAVPHHERELARGQGGFAPVQLVIAATTFLTGMGFGTVMTFIPTFMLSEGLGRVGFFFAAYTTMAIAVRVVGAGLSDRFGRRAVILPTLIALSTSIVVLSQAHSLPVLIVAGAIFGTAQGLNYPTLHAFLVDSSHESYLGRAQALFNGAFNLGVTCSAFLLGSVAEHYGYRPMFLLAAAAPLAGCAVFYRLARS